MGASDIRTNPTVRRVRRRLAILRRTGRLRPDHIRLARSGQLIHVDPGDTRGWEIVRGLGRGHQPALIDLWVRALERLHPTLALDVGTNYGELLLSGRYPEGCQAHAFEANPRVVSYLRRSIDAHPDRARITVQPVLAAAEDGGTADLAVDPAWSGSAAMGLDRTQRGERLVHVTVDVRSIDTVVGTQVPTGPLVVKIDTEGSELGVVLGMARLLEAATAVVGIVEFDPHHLRRSGTDPAQLFDLLRGIGPTWSISWEGALTAVDAPPTEPTDLLVASDLADAVALGAPAV